MNTLWRDLFQMAERESIPIGVHFDLTYRCNLRCVHCYLPEGSRHITANREEELTTQEVYGILDQLAESGTLFATFSGGEIFVRRDILDIIEYARKKKFHVSLKTTGTIGFDERTADRLADAGMRGIEISVYSAEPEVHDSITGVPGSLNRTIRTIELLNEREIKIKLNCPLMKNNIGTLRSVPELAESYGIPWAFDPSITVGKYGDRRPAHLRMSDEELAEYCTFEMEVPGSRNTGEAEEIKLPLSDEQLSEGPCGGARFSSYISPYGDVQPCIEINMICGNLREQSFMEIWENSEEMLMVRAIMRKDQKKCPDCPEPDLCFRCMGQSYIESGDLLAPAEEFCRIAKMRRQVRDQAAKIL